MDPNFTQQPASPPGKGKAIASLVLGIVSLVFPVPFFGLIVGIIGLVMASGARKEGFSGGLQTGGFVCSLIGTIFGALVLLLVIIGIGLSLAFLDFFFFYF